MPNVHLIWSPHATPLIAGRCGTGKRHIAQALGHRAVRAGYDVLFATQTKLLGQLHAASATDTFQRRFLNVVKTPLLIIDDFGLKPMTPPHDEDFHDIISERYVRAATIVTSNLDFSEWGHAFPNRLRDIVKCCGWWRAHPDGLSGGFDVSVLKFNALEDEFNEFVTV